jgi:hypothetical protein
LPIYIDRWRANNTMYMQFWTLISMNNNNNNNKKGKKGR